MPSEYRFVRESRLRSPELFQHVYQTGRRFQQDGIRFTVCKNDLPYSRLGMTVPKRQVALAVQRNTLKRLIREAFRIRCHALSVSLDIVVTVYADFLQRDRAEQRTCLEDIWQKLIRYYKAD